MYQWAEGIKEGAAICYGPSFDETFQQWGRLTGKVLRGTRPGDLPVEQPTSFKLTINLKVARQLGITAPASMLQRADEIVE
jgi:putative ABC transport system substrate-binding protein